MKKELIIKDTRIKLSKPIRTRCCNFNIIEGSVILISGFNSLSRGYPLTNQFVVLIEEGICSGALHQIKISSIEGNIL